MERQERSTLETFRRVQAFLAHHPLADSPADIWEQLSRPLRHLRGNAYGWRTNRTGPPNNR